MTAAFSKGEKHEQFKSLMKRGKMSKSFLAKRKAPSGE
jgi:hypothetical protein